MGFFVSDHDRHGLVLDSDHLVPSPPNHYYCSSVCGEGSLGQKGQNEGALSQQWQLQGPAILTT